MRSNIRPVASIAALLLSTTLLFAVSPTDEEMAERDLWVSAKFESASKEAVWKPGLAVLAH